MGTLGEVLKIDTPLNNLLHLRIYNFGHWMPHFSSKTLHVIIALKSEYLFVVWVKPFRANQNVKYECFHCAFQIFHIFAGDVLRIDGFMMIRPQI